jgi:hypothetical protein
MEEISSCSFDGLRGEEVVDLWFLLYLCGFIVLGRFEMGGEDMTDSRSWRIKGAEALGVDWRALCNCTRS